MAGGSSGKATFMLLYPQEPRQRRRTLLGDLVTLALIAALGVLGLKVHGAVDRLAVLGEGVTAAGGSVRGGFESAAEGVDGVPLVGDDLADGLRGAGEETGGEVEGLGRQGEDAAHTLALLLGLVVFLVPAVLVLNAHLPPRIAQVRRLTAAHKVIGETRGDDEKRLLAMRAAFSLPYGLLLEYSRDPLGDLAAGRYEPLVAAALEDAGLRPPATS